MRIGIGIGSHERWGDDRYKKLKEHGFSCIDYNMMGTDYFPYCDSLEVQKKDF